MMRLDTFKFWDFAELILEVWRWTSYKESRHYRSLITRTHQLRWLVVFSMHYIVINNYKQHKLFMWSQVYQRYKYSSAWSKYGSRTTFFNDTFVQYNATIRLGNGTGAASVSHNITFLRPREVFNLQDYLLFKYRNYKFPKHLGHSAPVKLKATQSFNHQSRGFRYFVRSD